MAGFGKRPTRSEMMLQHLIVFLICVVFPGSLTYSLPVTWITLWRTPEAVNCKTWTCVFFVVPFQVQQVSDVEQVDSRKIAGRAENVRQAGRSTGQTVHVDGKGWLQILGSGQQKIEVMVSPASLESVTEKARKFLASDQANSMTMFTIANWKFGGLMGGVLTSLTALYALSNVAAWFKCCFGRRGTV